MADSVRIAQPTVLEIPVTVQGSKTVEGTEQRELFKETTKTTTVSEKGAVLKLNARVLPGQCVFLRNELSGREILCRVRELREAGQAGFTDLEFTVYDPKFWDAPAEQSAAAVQKPEVQKGNEAAENPAATSSVESAAPASEEIPATVPKIALMASSDPAPETPVALPEPDWDDAKDAELVAALSAMEASSKAQREPVAEVTKKSAQGVELAVVPEPSVASPNRASETLVLPTPPAVIRKIREFAAVKNPIAAGIAATLLIAAVLGFAWHARGGPSTHSSDQGFAGSDRSGQKAASATAQSSPPPASSAATGTNSGGATTGVAIVQSPAATAPNFVEVRGKDAVENSGASAARKASATGNLAGLDHRAMGPAMHRKSNKANPGETIPARIVWQSPTSFPLWAKEFEMDGVVTLDALIDDKGNVVETKLLSGPHVLQSAAERAVELWVIEPAMSDGKATATHLVITVEFQR
jgi:TonB-like protein